MRTILLLGLTFVGFMGATTNAATPIDAVEAQYNKCMDDAMSTADYNQCIDTAYSAADAELNSVYNKIKSSYSKEKDEDSKETLRRLKASERAWITFRDANCTLAGVQMLGGSGEGPMIGGCQVTTTISRVKELNSIFNVEN